MQNSSRRIRADRYPTRDADVALRTMFYEVAERLNVEGPLTIESLPEALRAATSRFVFDMRAKDAQPEEMLRRIKLALGNAPTPAQRENARRLSAVVVSFAIDSYFAPDKRQD